ncbi:hypothetical protein TeGR_g10354 [Tetraparma gracilis]|uniref:Uncharacterized protein n=1 Tax=Tetraparma gracilis TaxID=2962635 RepID=A0ABQ6M5B5_9STRA|nr:hypothetical protein TeGR_g10354 [Tetraparma gracilis]
MCKIFSTNSRTIAGLRPFKPFLTAVPSDNPFPIFSVQERALSVLSIAGVSDVVVGAPPVPTPELLDSLGVSVLCVDARPREPLFQFPDLTEAAMGVTVQRVESAAGASEWEVLQRL